MNPRKGHWSPRAPNRPEFSARELVANCRDELVPARYVQGEAEILAAPAQRYAEINALMADVLGYLLRDRPSPARGD